MQTNVALTKGRRGENSTDFTVNNSLIRRKTTYISIIGATKRYSFFNKNVLDENLGFFFKLLKVSMLFDRCACHFRSLGRSSFEIWSTLECNSTLLQALCLRTDT